MKLYDVRKWLHDVEVEQVVLRISFLIWEMHQSHWEKLYADFGPFIYPSKVLIGVW